MKIQIQSFLIHQIIIIGALGQEFDHIHEELKRDGNFDHKWLDSSEFEEHEFEYTLKPRFLSEDYIESGSKSNRCKTDCIDEGGTFCLNIFYTGGTCYEPKERFETMRSTYSYCSDENKKAPSYFKYWVCPNEPACESRVMVPDYGGEVLKRSVDKYTHKFVQGDVCAYQIDGPWQMTSKDKMYMKIYNIENADVYLAKGKKYIWFNHLDQMVKDGDIFDTKAGWSFYVVGVSNSIFRGTFTMKIWIEKNAAKSLLKVPEKKKKKEPEKVEVVTEEEEEEEIELEEEIADNGPTEASSPISQNTVDKSERPPRQREEVTREREDRTNQQSTRERRPAVNDRAPRESEDKTKEVRDEPVDELTQEELLLMQAKYEADKKRMRLEKELEELREVQMSSGNHASVVIALIIMTVIILGATALAIYRTLTKDDIHKVSTEKKLRAQNDAPVEMYDANNLLRNRRNNDLPEGLSDMDDSIEATSNFTMGSRHQAKNRTALDMASQFSYNTTNTQKQNFNPMLIQPDQKGNFNPQQMMQMYQMFQAMQLAQQQAQGQNVPSFYAQTPKESQSVSNVKVDPISHRSQTTDQPVPETPFYGTTNPLFEAKRQSQLLEPQEQQRTKKAFREGNLKLDDLTVEDNEQQQTRINPAKNIVPSQNDKPKDSATPTNNNLRQSTGNPLQELQKIDQLNNRDKNNTSYLTNESQRALIPPQEETHLTVGADIQNQNDTAVQRPKKKKKKKAKKKDAENGALIEDLQLQEQQTQLEAQLDKGPLDDEFNFEGIQLDGEPSD